MYLTKIILIIKWAINNCMRKLLLLLLLPFTAHADYADWNKYDKELFWMSTTAIALDHLTTRDLASRYDEGYRERNPLLGDHPDKDTVDLFFLVNYVTHYYLTDYFQGDNRPVYMMTRLVVNGAASINNFNIGLGIRF
tara:strand:- start:70 stop:483 length:414 start_codon:yes stop_codon:yes gene_type:complete